MPSTVFNLLACTSNAPEWGFLPLDFHRVKDEEGISTVSRQAIENTVTNLNALYTGYGYQFYLHDIIDENLDALLADNLLNIDNPIADESSQIIDAIDTTGSLDILALDTEVSLLVEGMEKAGGYCDKAWGTPRYVVYYANASLTEPNDLSSVLLAHEIGHYLGLETLEKPENIMCPYDTLPSIYDDNPEQSEWLSLGWCEMDQSHFNPDQLDEMEKEAIQLFNRGKLTLEAKPNSQLDTPSLITLNCKTPAGMTDFNQALQDTSIGGTIETCDFEFREPLEIVNLDLTLKGRSAGDLIFAGGGENSLVDLCGATLRFDSTSFIQGQPAINAGEPEYFNNIRGTDCFGENFLTINDSLFWLNNGAIYFQNGSLEVSGSYFYDNFLTIGEGAAIKTKNYTDFKVSQSTFVGNSSEYGGGAISIGGEGDQALPGGFTNISDSTFIDNTTLYDRGGAIKVNSSNLQINDSRFVDNSAQTVGTIDSDDSFLGLSNVVVEGGIGYNTGVPFDSVYTNSSVVDIQGSRFFGGNEGASSHLLSLDNSEATILQSIFYGGDGDLTLVYFYNTDLTLENSILLNESTDDFAESLNGIFGSAQITQSTMVSTGYFTLSVLEAPVQISHSVIVSANALGTCDLFEGATIVETGPNFSNGDNCLEDGPSVGAVDDPLAYFLTGYYDDYGYPLLYPDPTGPLYDAGEAQCPIAEDLLGTTRPQGPACDLGALEGDK